MLLILHINRGKKSCMKGKLMALGEAALGMPFFSRENYSPKPYVFLFSTWTNLVCCKDT